MDDILLSAQAVIATDCSRNRLASLCCSSHVPDNLYSAISFPSNAYNAENYINELRNSLRNAEIEALENGGKNYQASVYYMDILNEFERMGDFIINISQDLEKAFANK